MAKPLKLRCLRRVDKEGNEYFFTRPNMPCSVDLSKVVIFVHPFKLGNGDSGADLIIKDYTGPKKDIQ